MKRKKIIYILEAILDNEEFCNFVEYMMNSSKTTQDPMLPLCKYFFIISMDQVYPMIDFVVGGPTDIEDFLDFIEHPETHNDLQGLFSFSLSF